MKQNHIRCALAVHALKTNGKRKQELPCWVMAGQNSTAVQQTCKLLQVEEHTLGYTIR